MSNFLGDIAASEELRNAALLSAAGLLVAVLVSGMRRSRAPVPLGGLLVATAALPVLWQRFPMPAMVIVGCAAMAVASLLGGTLGERFVGNLVGAYVITFAVGTDVAIHPVVTGAALALCAALVVEHDEGFRDAASSMPLFLGSTVGVLLTVPDTERAMVLFGAALPLALLGWPAKIGRFGPAGAAAVGVLGYVAVTAARAGAVVGSFASLGLLLVEPLGRLVAKRQPTALQTIAATRRVGFYVFVLIHGFVVFGASRIAGIREDALTALLVSLPFLGVGLVASAAPGNATTWSEAPTSTP